MTSRLRALVFGVLVVLSSAVVEAAPVLEIMGAANSIQPFTARVVGTGAAVSYFNPALLPYQPNRFGLDFLAALGRLRIDYESRPPGSDISAEIYDALPVGGESAGRSFRPLPTDKLRSPRGHHDPSQTDLYLAIGSTKPFLDGRLAFGLYALFPLQRFQAHRPFFNDEREQYFSNSLRFELFEDRLEIAGFVFGFGGRPLEWLSLGAGLTLWSSTVAHTELFVPDAGNQQKNEINSTTEITFSVVPHFGLSVSPWRGLRLTSTVHLAAQSGVDGRSDLQFWRYDYPEGESSLIKDFEFAYGYLPLRVSAGVAWFEEQEEGPSWSAALSVLWAMWSDYRDRHKGKTDPRWSDTVTIAASGEVSFREHRAGLSLSWVPTPVPESRGRRNYVDNDRVGVALGWESSFDLGRVAIGGGLNVQAQWLIPRRVVKDPTLIPDEFPESDHVLTGERIASSIGLQSNNPGYPGFRSSGVIVGLGASFHLEF